jgi:guanylate kinase
MNRIFYLIGKSSSGKDTIYSRILAELPLKPIVLYTTRPKRDSETEGVEYHFVDRKTYDDMLERGCIIEARTYDTVHGLWTYFTSADGIDLESGSCAGIGTLESLEKMRDYFGYDRVVPIYIEVSDDIRFLRAVERERRQHEPRYTELCRRFLADNEDFSETNLEKAGIDTRFDNSGEPDECFERIKSYIMDIM